MKRTVTIVMLLCAIFIGGTIAEAKTTKKKAKSSSVIAKIKINDRGSVTLYSNGKAKFPHECSGDWKKRGNQIYYLTVDGGEGYEMDVIIGNTVYRIHAGSTGGFEDIDYNPTNKTITFKDFWDGDEEYFLERYNLSSFTVSTDKFGSIFPKVGTVTWTK